MVREARPELNTSEQTQPRPGRWPKLLAPVRTRNPLRISRAKPYRQTAALHSKGRGTDRQQRTQTDQNKKIKDKINLPQRTFV